MDIEEHEEQELEQAQKEIPNLVHQTEGKETKSRPYPVPVYGLQGQFQGGDQHASPSKIRGYDESLETIRSVFIQSGMDTHNFILELKRMFRIGAIELSPKNVAMMVKAEKDNFEMLLRAADKEGRFTTTDSKTMVLQIINQISQIGDAVAPQAMDMLSAMPKAIADVIEAEIVVTPPEPGSPEDKLARFAKSKELPNVQLDL